MSRLKRNPDLSTMLVQNKKTAIVKQINVRNLVSRNNVSINDFEIQNNIVIPKNKIGGRK